MDALQIWRILGFVAYAAAVPVIWAAWRRRRWDLIVIAVIIYTLSLWGTIQIGYLQADSMVDGTTIDTIYTVVLKNNNVERYRLAAIDWGITVVLIYTSAPESISQERLLFFITFITLVGLTASNVIYRSIIGTRILITLPLFIFFVFNRLLRNIYVYLNLAFYVAGFAEFYSGYLLSFTARFVGDATTRVALDFFWILFTSIGLVLLILAVPPAFSIHVKRDMTVTGVSSENNLSALEAYDDDSPDASKVPDEKIRPRSWLDPTIFTA